MKKILPVFILVFFISTTAFAKVKVVTTTFILSSIVKQIGGKYVDTTYLIPIGSNPHIFSPKPKSLVKLAKADIFIGVGYGFEFWLASIREFLNGKDVIFLSDYYKNPIDKKVIGGYTIANPHIWLDLRFMGNIAVYKIADKLCKYDKIHCEDFLENAHILSKKIKNIRLLYEKNLNNRNKYCFLDIKPAFEYLLRSIGTHSCCVLIKKGNEEPAIGDIKEALNRCRCKKGVVLYISDTQLANMMAEKLHFKKALLNPLGDSKNLNTYEKLMMYNLDKLEHALK